MSEEVAIADWEAVADVLERMIENISGGISELCELRYFHGCTAINKDIMPYFRRMLREVERKSHAEEFPELDEELPPRGTGLETGAAGERRAGLPRTEEERRLRHEELYVGREKPSVETMRARERDEREVYGEEEEEELF